MEISYQLFEKEKLFVQKYIGLFSLEEYIRYTRFIISRYPSVVVEKVINDFRDLDIKDPNTSFHGDFNNMLDKITSVRRDLNNNELKNKEVTLVFWVDKPLPTVIAHLFVKLFSDKNYHYCSTIKNIMTILQLPQQFKNLNAIVANLENSFNPN
jgi:hypothetical protein